MKVLVAVSALLAVAQCGVIHHESADGHTATSYQNFHMEHFHAVPTYIKKEDKQYLEHPISRGKTSSSVKVHHGHDKHDPGYATASVQSDFGKGHQESGEVQGNSGSQEQEYALAAQQYQGHENGLAAQYQGHENGLAAQYQGHENVEAAGQGYEEAQKSYEAVQSGYEGHGQEEYEASADQGAEHQAQEDAAQADAALQHYITVPARGGQGLGHYH
ncbi:PREDICTED: uncharacterized protein LOC108563518 [Nicrophorus vespilloides]|uniref:Uncharacterized protein LOC108563518 n=1 Tax=Nicrophorus vespilloides TaxID=110193 RepID=A0ABM1MT03_NICVS|nr:PREDICTED: uncharacterized protein LOC108563518 [Nicrophorus vespilloides]